MNSMPSGADSRIRPTRTGEEEIMHRDLCRGSLLAASAIAAALILGADAAAAQTALTVGKSAPNADPIIPVNVGERLGIFKKHGLDLTIVDFGGGARMTQAMTAGSIDIGDGAGTEMAYVAKGAPLLGVGVPPDSPIRSLAELKGKKIGVSTSGSLTDWLTKELARTQGWGPNGVTAVTIGNAVASITAAFRERLVDADISTTSLFLTMEANKTGRLLFPVTEFAGKLAAGALFASNRLIETNPDAVRAFVAGWVETVDYIRAHKAEAVKLQSAITGFPESVMAREYDLTIGMFTKACEFDAESLANLKRSFID